jgi:hypothetical protein
MSLRTVPADAVALWKTPLGKLMAAALVLRLAGLVWGLPASDGWDDDGVAPRDFLVGLGDTYAPGHHYIYPPLHLLILAVVLAPVWITTLLHAPSWAPDAVVHTFIAVGPMTAMAVLARLVSTAMSLGILWNAAKIGETLGGSPRAGFWTAAACALDAVFTYYSQTTNLDVPYLFWGTLSLRWLVAAVARREPRLLRRVAWLAACGVATKDQAYALFLVGVPATLAIWLALDRTARALAGQIARDLAVGAAIALILLLAVDGALVNPHGFMDRIRTLLGPASQNHANYPATWAGREALLRDIVLAFRSFYPWLFVPFIALGIAVALRTPDGPEGPIRGPDPARRAASLAPLAFALSFTLAFNLTARRTEARFLLPQSLYCGIYAGIAFAWIAKRAPLGLRALACAVVGGAVAPALFGCVAVDVAMLRDPRYDAEAWMRDHIRPGDTLEVYGNDVHLPRLPQDAVLTRVDSTPLKGRNPLPGLREVEDSFSNVEARKPRFILVSEFWAYKYLALPEQLTAKGRSVSGEQMAIDRDEEARDYFRRLRDGLTAYRFAHISTWTSRIWPRVDIHASLTRDVWIFERNDTPGSS